MIYKISFSSVRYDLRVCGKVTESVGSGQKAVSREQSVVGKNKKGASLGIVI